MLMITYSAGVIDFEVDLAVLKGVVHKPTPDPLITKVALCCIRMF